MLTEADYEDRDLFAVLSNADDETAERILSGDAFTWEVHQITRYRLAERARTVAKIVAWLRDNPRGMLEYEEYYAEQIEAKFGATNVAG